MSEIPLQPGDVLQDIYGGDLLLLIEQSEQESDGERWDTWNFLNLTSGTTSWWYAVSLEDETEFRRI